MKDTEYSLNKQDFDQLGWQDYYGSEDLGGFVDFDNYETCNIMIYENHVTYWGSNGQQAGDSFEWPGTSQDIEDDIQHLLEWHEGKSETATRLSDPPPETPTPTPATPCKLQSTPPVTDTRLPDTYKGATISEGTTKLWDIIPKLLPVADTVAKDRVTSLLETFHITRETDWKDYCDWDINLDDPAWFYDDLIDLITEISPEGYYCGGHPDYPDSIGIWPMDFLDY